jgi:tetratricopeptide (TPR) repeat protein
VSRRGFGPAVVVLALALGLPAHAAGVDEVAYARATALARAGRCPEALAVLAEISAPTAKSTHLRAQCQLDAKDWPAALASLEETKRLDPATPGVELHLAVARFHMGDYDGSREALDRAAPTAQDDPQYHLYRGLVLLQAARSGEAARELARARTLGPSTVEPGASYYEGLAWAGAEDTEKARESFDRVIATAPGTVWAAEAERAKADLGRLASGRGDVWAFARAGLEYDDNVRLLADDVFPSNDATADPNRDSHDMRAVWLLHGGAQLLSGEDWAAGVAATYYGSAHFDLTEFNEHYPLVGVWYDQRVAEATSLRLSYDVGYAWYQYDPFLFSNQARASLFHDFGEPGRTELFVTGYKYNYLYSVDDVQDGPGTVGLDCADDTRICGPLGLDEEDARNRDGWGLTTGVEHRFPFDAIDTELLGGVAYLYYGARGSEYSYNGVGTWVGSDTALPWEMAFRTSIGYSHLSYRNSSTYPDPDDPNLDFPTNQYALDGDDRSDDRWSYAVELEKYITDAWSTSLRYSYTNDNSNVDVFAYDREIIGAYVTYRLKR